MKTDRYYNCPKCDSELPVSKTGKVYCTDCGTSLLFNEDAEFIDGRWRDSSSLHEEPECEHRYPDGSSAWLQVPFSYRYWQGRESWQCRCELCGVRRNFGD